LNTPIDKSSVEEIELGTTASLQYVNNFITHKESRALINLWTEELDWEQSTIQIFGKRVSIPRLNCWYGDHAYTYSGTRFEPKPMPPKLLKIKDRVERFSQLSFNSVLVNWYRDGQDCMGWHSDDEQSLGTHPQIASISLGDPRRFSLREKDNKSNQYKLQLEDGSLLLMLGDTQTLWQHALPKTKTSQHSRLNLTFRKIVQTPTFER